MENLFHGLCHESRLEETAVGFFYVVASLPAHDLPSPSLQLLACHIASYVY
jgi:hypothetical protein